MMIREDSPTAEGQIESTFEATGRGLVLVLRDGFSGTILRDGTIVSQLGAANFSGPDFLDGQGRSAVCVTVQTVHAANLFAAGDAVRFYPPETSRAALSVTPCRTRRD
jgi:hypothetical protein